MNIYQHVYDVFIAEIHKYKPGLTVTKNKVVAKQPSYPFVSLFIYNDENEVGGSNNTPWFFAHLQIKAISNNEVEAKSLGRWLRHIFYLQQPLEDLFDRGIIPAKDVGSLLDPTTFIQYSYQHTAGADMKIAVYDPITDDTEPGNFDSISSHFNTTGYFNKKGD